MGWGGEGSKSTNHLCAHGYFPKTTHSEDFEVVYTVVSCANVAQNDATGSNYI